jgi:hypothetical protein
MNCGGGGDEDEEEERGECWLHVLSSKCPQTGKPILLHLLERVRSPISQKNNRVSSHTAVQF